MQCNSQCKLNDPIMLAAPCCAVSTPLVHVLEACCTSDGLGHVVLAVHCCKMQHSTNMSLEIGSVRCLSCSHQLGVVVKQVQNVLKLAEEL